VNISVIEITDNKDYQFRINENRQAYVVLITGQVMINDLELIEGESIESTAGLLVVNSKIKSHLLVVEMKDAS